MNNEKWIDTITAKVLSLKYPHLIYTVLAFTSARLRKKLIDVLAVIIADNLQEEK